MASLCYESINYSPFIAEQVADLSAQIEAAARAGFPWIGIDASSVAQHLERGGHLDELAAALDRHGIRCFEVQALVIGPDEATTLAEAERIAEIAAALKPRWVQSGLTEAVSDASVASFRRAAEIVAPTGARLAVEYLPFLPLNGIRATRELLDRAGVEGAGIVVDTWHFFHGPDTWDDLEALALEQLAYVQFDDHPALESDDLMFETTQRRVLPGDGSFDLARFCDVVKRKGFDDVVSVEILSEELRRLPEAEFARRVFDAAQRFWQ